MTISTQYLQTLVDSQKPTSNSIKFKCYDCPPVVFLVLTDQVVFVEPYPMAETASGPIGGYMPMVIARRDSKAYDLWEKHFNYTWNSLSHVYGDDCGGR